MGRDSSVGIANGYGLTAQGSNLGGGEIIRARLDRPWGPPPPPVQRVSDLFSSGKAAGAWL